MRTRTRITLAGAALAAALVGGVAWATIPGDGGVYTACKLNATGTIRLIDLSLPSNSLLQHCTSLETQITWNQKGQKGDVGAVGPAGPQGSAGAAGTNGLDGKNGADGAKGDPCLPSDPACVGPPGEKGATGETGPTGPAGTPGTGTTTVRSVVVTLAAGVNAAEPVTVIADPGVGSILAGCRLNTQGTPVSDVFYSNTSSTSHNVGFWGATAANIVPPGGTFPAPPGVLVQQQRYLVRFDPATPPTPSDPAAVFEYLATVLRNQNGGAVCTYTFEITLNP